MPQSQLKHILGSLKDKEKHSVKATLKRSIGQRNRTTVKQMKNIPQKII